jgi:gastrin-releasing peptide receptor
MINHASILTAITILHLAFVTFTLDTYKKDAAIWSQTGTTNDGKDDSSGADSEQSTATNIPESFTYLANTLHNKSNTSLENLVSTFNISGYVGNCTDQDADGFQYISYDGESLPGLVSTAWELHAEFNALIETAMRFSCTENETLGHAVIAMSQTYVDKCTEFVVALNGTSAAVGDAAVLDTAADLYRNSIRHVESVRKLVEHLTEMISEESKIDAVYKIMNQQAEEASLFNLSSVWETIVLEQNEVVSVVKNCSERAGNMSKHREENPFIKAITSSNISRFLDADYWADRIQEETHVLQTQQTNLSVLQQDDFVQYKLKAVIMAIVLLVGMAGNGLLLTIFIRHKETRTLPNSMLINLTVVDCVSLVLNLLLEYFRVTVPWQIGLLACKLFFFFRYVFVGVSTYSVVMISFQRFVAVKGLHSLAWCHQGKKAKYFLIAAVWALGVILSVPHALIADINRALCSEISRHNFGPVCTADLILFCVVPLITAAAFSGVTAYRIRRSIRRMPGEATGHEQLKHNRMVSSNVLVALVVLFVVSYTPDFLFKFLTIQAGITLPDWQFNLVNVITYYLRFVNCCLNPIVLFVMSARYRGYIKRYCGQRKTQPASKSESSIETTL